MTILNLDPNLLERNPDTRVSSHCYVAFNTSLELELYAKYGVPTLCLKIFEGHDWYGTSLIDATIIQNLFAMNYLSPRIYDTVTLDNGRVAQVTRFVEPEGEPRISQALQLMDKLDIVHRKQSTVKNPVESWVGKWLIDFGGLIFKDKQAYEDNLVERIKAIRKKTPGNRGYQNIPELGVNGSRDVNHKLKLMGWGDVKAEGLSVLDIGCAMGFYSRWLADEGAQPVIGIDRGHIPELAREVDNWFGSWNIDRLNLDIPKTGQFATIRKATGRKHKSFDIVLALSVVNYFGGYGSWLADLTGMVLYLEGHGGETREKYQGILERDFSKVEFLGMTTDAKERPLFRCWK